MKIAILTQPLRTNFGGILQNYALQTALRRLGHEPVTIDYDCRYTKGRWILGRLKSILTGSVHKIQFPRYNRSGQENLNRFIHEHIRMTKPVNNPTKEIFYSINPDAFVVGSDQVWSTMCNVPIEYLGNMYLDFAPEYEGKRVAYAASFGRAEWTYTEDWTAKCKALAQRFDAISVREASGIDLCRDYLNVKATHVLDPTMLLTGDDYSKLIPYSKREANTLFAYVLDISEEKKNFLNEVAAKFGLDLVIKGANDDLTWDDSIEGWLSDIRDASMVVTDSFHGSVFSILFHRPFLSIVNYRRGAERFTSLLGKLGLNDRLVSTDSNLAYTTKQIDWDAVDAKLTEERILSYNFLKQAL